MKGKNRLLKISALGVYAFLYLPLLIVVIYSFNDSKLNAEWVGFTWNGTTNCLITGRCSPPPATR